MVLYPRPVVRLTTLRYHARYLGLQETQQSTLVVREAVEPRRAAKRLLRQRSSFRRKETEKETCLLEPHWALTEHAYSNTPPRTCGDTENS